jgi:hypothetical protein
MPSYLYNETDGPIRVDDGQGHLRRFPPGQPVQVSGDLEKNAGGVEGLRSATDEEVNAASGEPQPGSRDVTRDQALADLSAYARTVTVAVPLNEVIGDDEAPYGPPSGTITTKQAVARGAENSSERQRFGQHEWLPEDAEGRDLSPVQEAQAQASGRVEAMTEKIQNLGPDDKLEVGGDEVKGAAGDPGPGRGDPMPAANKSGGQARRRNRKEEKQEPSPPSQPSQ